MKNSKQDLINRILFFRKNRRFDPGIKSFKSLSDSRRHEMDLESLKKGNDFEKFVVRKFDPEYFTLIEWRSDKNVEGIFPLMSKFPDLEFYYESKTESLHFSVECKWREGFSKEKISLDKFHIQNYKHYASVLGYPTFLVLGVGNTPSYPNRVYIIPLQDINSEVLHEFEIEVYRRKKPHDNFFISCNTKILK